MIDNSQSKHHLHLEIGILRQRIAELEAAPPPALPTAYGDFLFENSGETILIIDPYSMKIMDANPNAARRLGYGRAELCQLRLEQIEMPHSLDVNDAETAWQSSASGTSFYEGRYRHKDGSLIPVEISSRLVHWQDKAVLLNVVRNIRRRKESEMALQQINNTLEQQVQVRTAELAAKNMKLEAALACITEGIAMTDTAQQITYINPAFVMMSGYSLAQVKGQCLSTIFDFSVTDRETQKISWEAGTAWTEELTGVRKNGRTYPAIVTIMPMFTEDGRLTGYISSHKDISQFKALNDAQYSFITNVSHQLRTPLTNIKLYTQLLEDSLHNGKAGDYLQVLGSQAERLEHLVQDIIELARLDSAQSTFDWRPIEMEDLITQITESNKKHAAMQEQTLHCTAYGIIPTFLGDVTRLRQAFGELLDNAVTYTPNGGTISVEIAAPIKDHRQWITVRVQDDGPGIDAPEHAQIFERFYRGRLAEQGDTIGTGLGLCISQQIVQAHHGHIALQSEPGEGATFTVWLPLAETD